VSQVIQVVRHPMSRHQVVRPGTSRMASGTTKFRAGALPTAALSGNRTYEAQPAHRPLCAHVGRSEPGSDHPEPDIQPDA
jgi:hypothetical protein